MTADDHPTAPPPTDPSDSSAADRRAHMRQKVLWSGTMALGDGEVECTIHDISGGGARLNTRQMLQAEDQVMLKVHGLGEVPGRIAWRDGNLVGVAFLVGASYITRMIVARSAPEG